MARRILVRFVAIISVRPPAKHPDRLKIQSQSRKRANDEAAIG
jgi:hypothetical protein